MSKELEQRVDDLEIHAAHQSDTIDALNDTVKQQWRQIDALNQLMERMRERLSEVEASVPGGHEITKPPHY